MFKKWFGKKEAAPAEKSAEKIVEKAASMPPAAPAPCEAAGESSAAPAPVALAAASAPRRGAWSLLKAGLAKTRAGLKSLFAFRGKLDEATILQIEAQLYAADFGPEMVHEIIDGGKGIRAAWKARAIEDADQVAGFLRDLLREILTRRSGELKRAAAGPTVYLIAGVNGTGKTTSIAKLAFLLKKSGGKVLLAAGDTFRAAAVEQLRVWSQRLEIPIVTGKPQADPASVVYQALDQLEREPFDYLIVDTAGRLHTQKNLMRELKKIRDVIGRRVPGAPHESLLVLDATTGQNALNQALAFKEEIEITGIILTKLDGTAKGGIVVTINNRLEVPVKLVGVGEGLADMEVFQAENFVDALLEEEARH